MLIFSAEERKPGNNRLLGTLLTKVIELEERSTDQGPSCNIILGTGGIF